MTSSVNITYPYLNNDLLTATFEQYGYAAFTFLEVFDTSADGQSGGTVHLSANSIGSNRIVLAIQPVRPGGSVSLFIVGYSEDYFEGGNSFLFGRFFPGYEIIYG